MTSCGTVGLISAFSLVNNLFEKKGADAEDCDDGPDFERGL